MNVFIQRNDIPPKPINFEISECVDIDNSQIIKIRVLCHLILSCVYNRDTKYGEDEKVKYFGYIVTMGRKINYIISIGIIC